jgi:predicted nucleic acid binding AN1-type Zn finger protein
MSIDDIPGSENHQSSDNESKKKKKKIIKKTRCFVEGCKGRVVAMIGDCKWCNNCYCQTHRIPEAHDCKGMQACKKRSFDLNQKNVLSQKCVKSQIEGF